MSDTALFATLGDPIHTGKVRNTYALPGHTDFLLVYASDRVSTHNVVHDSHVHSKGRILTALTIHWAYLLEDQLGINHHIVAYGPSIREYLPAGEYSDELLAQCLVVQRLQMKPYEFIFRRYLTGSLWNKFQSKGLPNPYTGTVLPGDPPLMTRFDELLFTPTEKSDVDDPVFSASVLEEHAEAVEMLTEVFLFAEEHLARSDIALVDGKFEVGTTEQDGLMLLFLADEILTPDSCRYTNLANIRIGEEPSWLDKQPLRDIAEAKWGNGEKTPLTFDPIVLRKAEALYHQIFQGITGHKLESYILEIWRGEKPWLEKTLKRDDHP